MKPTQPTAPTQSELAAEFPRWHMWRTTDAGTWWATRRGPGWNREPRTLAANTAEELRASLRNQPATVTTTARPGGRAGRRTTGGAP